MTRQELEDALDRHGADLQRWPEALRQEAAALIARDPSAARLFARAERVEALVRDAAEPIPIDSALVGRIVDAYAARRAETDKH